MADTIANKSRIEKDWETEEMGTLIHHNEDEPMLWDVSHSDYSQKDVPQLM